MDMKLLRPAKVETCYAKIGIYGRSGTGKTYTASNLAIGISKNIGSNKPVAFIDTETGSDYLVKTFKKNKVELYVAKTRAFSDVLNIIKEAEKECSVLIIDSVTHIWQDIQTSYLKALNARMAKKGYSQQDSLEFHDWRIIKDEWQSYTDLFLNSKIHIIACGRAGNEYSYEINDRGKRELIKGDSKFKAETEFGYEPSLVFEMERKKRSADIKRKIKSKFDHIAFVRKDRNDELNGAEILNPKYSSFKSHWNFLAKDIEIEHKGIDTKDSSAMFKQDNNDEYANNRKQKKILLDEIETSIVYCFPGTTAIEKTAKAEILQQVFGTPSWEQIKAMCLDELACYHAVVTRMKNKYTPDMILPKDRSEIRDFISNLLQKNILPEEVAQKNINGGNNKKYDGFEEI